MFVLIVFFGEFVEPYIGSDNEFFPFDISDRFFIQHGLGKFTRLRFADIGYLFL